MEPGKSKRKIGKEGRRRDRVGQLSVGEMGNVIGKWRCCVMVVMIAER